jgi:flagellar protein FlbD
VILVTRLNREPLALNPDLIERISENPDTTVYLVDGSSHLVLEPMTEVIDRIHDARARVLARAAAAMQKE